MFRKLIVMTALAAILVSCSAGPAAVTDIAFNVSHLDLEIKETAQLHVLISPDNAVEPGLKWSSSAPAVASVSSSGLVTAQDNGTAEISVSTADGVKTASATVTVTTPVTGISLDTSKLGLKSGQSVQLTATVTPGSASNQQITWSTSNPEVATVAQSGQVTAKANGTATITARSRDGGHTAVAEVTVTTPVTGVALDKKTLTLKPGQTAQLSAMISPASASDQDVSWSSSNKHVATVNSTGLVTAKAKGTTVITVKTRDGGKTAAVTVTVPETGTADEMLMLDLVNQERKKAGLKPFKFNMDLTKVARIKSQDFIDNDYFDHESPVYGSPSDMMKQFGITFGVWAENLARHPSVESAHQGLMNSPGHRANILNPNLSEIGIGIKVNSGSYYITQMFIGF